MPRSWARSDREAVILSVHVQPGASRNEIVGEHGDALKIRLAARPVDSKANASLVAFVAERLDVLRSQVELIGGKASRHKRVRVSGTSLDAVEAAFRTGTDQAPAQVPQPAEAQHRRIRSSSAKSRPE
ncbi:MAG: YggU family protein [Sterolibacteriaceae bacterium]|uniref:UPF0235 protein IPH26_02575 n=1 Tax=Candidatus Methylophosphatis roskildensis TaxID=2899263 RepID=A0A9D7E0F6_9PROT|nr:YggU family protein [Candidatus Methylophosphatis roskildensis]MBK7234908.1 YggU family protein [Sterolibacteriaceae bacterium]